MQFQRTSGIGSLIVLLLVCESLSAGEWMFRLKDAHVQLRQALFDTDPHAAWEQVDRQTRQEAGRLAQYIRRRYPSLNEEQKQDLRNKLGITDDTKILKLYAADLLIAPFFLEAHPELLVGNREDVKLKDHGTRMAGPTAIVVQKKTSQETLVPYRFTAENHFGGQAMDYRAQLSIPTLESLLGPIPETAISDEEQSAQAADVFLRAQKAFLARDVEALWTLLDCDSQSQASHFADQAREQAAKKKDAAGIAEKIGISEEQLANLDGKQVWALAWTQEDLAMFAIAENPKYLPPAQFSRELVPVQAGSKHKYNRRDPPEASISFQADGRTWQLPVRINTRDGTPQMKLYLRPPYYQRLRR